MGVSARRDEIVRQLTRRHRGADLIGAGCAKLAIEMSRRHAGQIPPEVVADVTARFGAWLATACDATRSAAREREDADEGEAETP